MALRQFRHHTYFSSVGILPNRWCFVANQLLTSLVLLAALVQVIPAGISTNSADRGSDASAGEWVSGNTHAVELWMPQPTCSAIAVVAKLSNSDWLQAAWSTINGSLAVPLRVSCCTKGGTVNGDVCCLATLVDLNVRLQI